MTNFYIKMKIIINLPQNISLPTLKKNGILKEMIKFKKKENKEINPYLLTLTVSFLVVLP